MRGLQGKIQNKGENSKENRRKFKKRTDRGQKNELQDGSGGRTGRAFGGSSRQAAKQKSGAVQPSQTATGYIKKQMQLDEDIAVISIEITDEAGEKAFGKPRGTYVTIEIQGLLAEKENIRERAARAVAAELKNLIPFDYFLKVLVVGLGNEKVTPDSLGPHTVDKVKITRHLFAMFDCDGDWEMANVSGFNPSVTGVTGMETADLIEKVVSMVKPDVVLVIDALAAKISQGQHDRSDQ